MSELLHKYFPGELVDDIFENIKKYSIHLKFTKTRKSKAGDYRHPFLGKGHRISLNSSLNKYSMSITFYHELAHLLTWEKHRSRVLAHGEEWKKIFSDLLLHISQKGAFTPELTRLILKHAKNPKASTQSDLRLSLELKKHDKPKDSLNGYLPLNQLVEGDLFEYGDGRKFEKIKLKRTRIWCKELNTNVIFAFNPNVEVKVIRD